MMIFVLQLGIAIGESTLWGKGLGTHSALCMMDYASKELGITILKGETHEMNQRSKRMLEKLGFKEISRVGNEAYMGSKSRLVQYRLELTDHY